LWGVFKGARGGGFGVGRFKSGVDLEHNQFLSLYTNHMSSVARVIFQLFSTIMTGKSYVHYILMEWEFPSTARVWV
jgi:hypothetical protein